jgi:MFS family permease
MTLVLSAREASLVGWASPPAACILSSSTVGMDSMMTVVALPAMADDLGASLAAKQWVVAAHLLALGSVLLLGGAVGDALVASTAPVLIAARLVQGAVAASMVPGALVLVTSAYAGRHRSSAIAT